MAAALSDTIGNIGRFLRREFIALYPVFLFFLAGFLLLILLIKLVLAQLSIEVAALSTAIVGALFAAKAALILDDTPLARSLENYRRIVAIAVKTFLYGAATLLLGYLERFLDALRKAHSFNTAVQVMIAHANHYRLLAWVLGVSMVFGLYFSFVEISQRMGKGELRRLFFDAPAIAGGSALKINAGKRQG
jgi:uncharacterized membrane protein